MNRLAGTDLAYIAGLVETGAYIGVTRTRSSGAKSCTRGFSYRGMVCISSTNRALLEWMQGAIGAGKIAVHRSAAKAAATDRQRSWQLVLWSVQARLFLEQLRPGLTSAAPRADNLIAFQAMMRQPGAAGLTDHEWDERERRYLLSKSPNQERPK